MFKKTIFQNTVNKHRTQDTEHRTQNTDTEHRTQTHVKNGLIFGEFFLNRGITLPKR